MMPFGPKPVPPNRWFESKSLPARLVIMLAGVFMNVVLTFAIFGLALYYGEPTASTAPVIERRSCRGHPGGQRGPGQRRQH